MARRTLSSGRRARLRARRCDALGARRATLWRPGRRAVCQASRAWIEFTEARHETALALREPQGRVQVRGRVLATEDGHGGAGVAGRRTDVDRGVIVVIGVAAD